MLKKPYRETKRNEIARFRKPVFQQLAELRKGVFSRVPIGLARRPVHKPRVFAAGLLAKEDFGAWRGGLVFLQFPGR